MKITRRQFLQYCTASAAALGLSQTDLLKLEKALGAEVGGCEDYGVPRVIWMQGQSCGGCTLSILNRMRTEYPSEYINPSPGVTWSTTPLDGAAGAVQDVGDLLVGDAVGALTGTNPRTGWAPFPNGYISLDYQSEVMAGAGSLITDYVEDIEAGAPFFLAMSGAMPLMDPYVNVPNGRQPFSVAGSFDTGDGLGRKERSISEVMEWLGTSDNCLGIVAFGTCASYGGIPAGYGNMTAATGLYNFFVNYLGYNGSGGKPDFSGKIVNCPGCAPHPDWMIFPIAYFILTGTLPPMDTSLVWNRVWLGQQSVFTKEVQRNVPTAIYGSEKGYTFFCQACEKYSQDDLCTDLGAGPGNGDGTNQKEWCTREQGCNGPVARPDCPTRRWNNFDDHSPNSWCVGANYVCQGCAEPDFPDGRSPFFKADKYWS